MHALEKIIVYYNHCREQDVYRSTIEHLLKNLKKMEGATIYDVADFCFTSPATISRLSRRMGYEGFSDFRTSIVNCVRNYDVYNHFVPLQSVGSFGNEWDVYFTLIRRLEEEIRKNLDLSLVRRVNDLAAQANRISIYTCGNESVERHYQELLIVSGKPCIVKVLPSEQLEDTAKLTPQDLVICLVPQLLESGDTRAVLESVKAHQSKLVLISDTNRYMFRDQADVSIGFDGAMCAVDDMGFEMIMTTIFMDYRDRIVRGNG